jgi:hypothetical protein
VYSEGEPREGGRWRATWRVIRDVAASCALIWITYAMIWAPFPASYLKIKLSPMVLTKYRKLLHLTGDWDYFAPDPLFGRVVTYRIRTRTGEVLDFDLSQSIERSDPNYLRMERMFDSVTGVRGTRPSGYAQNFADYLCRQHAAVGPASLQFRSGVQRPLSVEDYRRGHRRFDGDHIVPIELDWLSCPRGRS